MKELKKYAAWNLFGSIVPGLVAVPAIGYLAKRLPTELLGALTITWAIVGSLSVLDLGVGRAITRYIAASAGDQARAGRGVGTALFIVLATSSVAALVIVLTAPWLASGLLRISAANQSDVVHALRLLALTIPTVVMTAVLQGHVEGLERFEILNVQRAFSGSILAVAPAAGILLGPSLTNAVLGLCCARLFALLLSVGVSLSVCRISLWLVDAAAARELFRFGSWLTVTNVLSSAMNYVDRFWLAHVHGSAVVAFYTVPSELILRLSMLPAAISRSFFPRLVSDPDGSRAMSRHGQRAIALICGPLCLLGLLAAAPALGIWGGEGVRCAGCDPASYPASWVFLQCHRADALYTAAGIWILGAHRENTPNRVRAVYCATDSFDRDSWCNRCGARVDDTGNSRLDDPRSHCQVEVG